MESTTLSEEYTDKEGRVTVWYLWVIL